MRLLPHARISHYCLTNGLRCGVVESVGDRTACVLFDGAVHLSSVPVGQLVVVAQGHPDAERCQACGLTDTDRAALLEWEVPPHTCEQLMMEVSS